MILKISDIPEEGLEQELQVQVRIDEETVSVSHASLDLSRNGRNVLVKGTCKSGMTLRCSRCLREFDWSFERKFMEEWSPANEMLQGGDIELSGSEMDVSYYDGDELDLDELVREQVLLEVPVKALCSEACRGLCVSCGKDLNDGPCGCVKHEIDPRLAPLAKLKHNSED